MDLSRNNVPLPSSTIETLASPSRPCWECQRRRRRCDLSRPECNKCLADKTVCPGYESQKPVTWLPPGTVLSRPRKRKTSQSRQGVAEGSDKTILLYVEKKTANSVPIFEWADETTAVLDTLCYFNSRIYSNLSPTLNLGPNPYVVKIPPEYLPYASVPFLHCLVSLVISHRIHQLPQGTNSGYVKELRLRIYYHQSIAIRAIRDCIEKAESGISTRVTFDIFGLMCAELQFSPVGSNWRLHYNGFMEIVTLRGGFENLFKSDTGFEYGLLGFMIIGIMANTTTPASRQTAARTYFSSMAFLSNMYKNVIYPTVLCPNPLLMHIILINYLREQVAESNLSREEGQTRAIALIEEINNFSAKEWVKDNAPFQELWLIVGQVYHSAVLLYCIASFQALFLPEISRTRSLKTKHYAKLMELLPQALNASQLKSSMCWPLVVASMHAEGYNAIYRPYLIAELTRMSHETGVALPLAATTVLQTYWASGKNGWDECFNHPFVFAW